MYPRRTVEAALVLSEADVLDRETALICSVSVGAVRHWRRGSRRRCGPNGDRWYAYPRYFFSNESADILGLCAAALDLLNVSWRFSRRNVISVARREAVARLDEIVGPKY